MTAYDTIAAVMDESDRAATHWPKHAGLWELLGPPLRPSPEDIAAVTAALTDQSSSSPRVLLLGATPELATLPWPDETELIAVDQSRAVLDNVFPTAGVPQQSSCVRAEWTRLPYGSDRFDVVLGDGVLTCLEFPTDYRALACELRRVLASDATIVLRIFAAPAEPETLDDIARDLSARAIESFHALKLRIGMAIQSAARSVAVSDILAAFQTLVPDWRRTAAECGWTTELIETIEPYRHSNARYSFPITAEVRECLASELDWVDATFPTYQLGERCPTLRLRPRAG